MAKITRLIISCMIVFNFLCIGVECMADNIQSCLAPSLIVNTGIIKQACLSEKSNQYISLPADAVPVPIEKFNNFLSKYSFFRDAYYHEHNPAYPNCCGAFSFFVGTKMVEELGDVYLLWSGMRDHYYLSIAVKMSNGTINEMVVDYTADQMGLGKIFPLIASREFIKEFFPVQYGLYYKENSLVMKPEDMLVDNFSLELIQIGEIIFDFEDGLEKVSPENIEIFSYTVENNSVIEQAV